MKEIRCKKCNGLLFKADGQIRELIGYIEIKCRKCGYINGWMPPLSPIGLESDKEYSLDELMNK